MELRKMKRHRLSDAEPSEVFDAIKEDPIPRRAEQGNLLLHSSRLLFLVGLIFSFVLLRSTWEDCETERRRSLFQSAPAAASFNFWSQKRGLVIFYHLPKTGGTFIRDTLINANMPVERVFSTKQLLGNKYGERIQKLLSGETTELLVLELHGRFVGIPQLPIRQWRDTALRHNVPFFAFTLLRDPVAFHDSYFSFFHRKGCQYRWCEPITYDEMSESHLLESLVPNKQCELLYHGQLELKWNVTEDRTVTKRQCDTVEKLLRNDWDWVGTTEQVSTSTIPKLFQLLLHQEPPPSVSAVAFVRQAKVVHSVTTTTAIRARSWMDERLYTASYDDKTRN